MTPKIAGVGSVSCRRWFGEKTGQELALDVIFEALSDAGLRAADLDGLYTTQVGWFALQEKFLAQRMAEILGCRAKAQAEVECGGASSLVALRMAASDVASGKVEAALVWAVDIEIPRKSFDPAKHLHLVEQARTWYGPYTAHYGLIGVVPLYALSAQAYMHRHGITREEVAALPVLLRSHAAKNPRAFLRDPITRSEVLSSRVVSPPLHFLDCAPWRDGAAAVVLVGGGDGVAIRSFGEAHDPTSFAPLTGDLARYENAARAAAEAYERAGIGPSDVDVAELYGAFSVTELQLYEELGFAEPGKAARAVADGETTYGGRVVCNPSGGRLSLGHPPYVTPLYEVVEIAEQLRGLSGDRRVAGAELGLVHAEHGMVNGSVIAILGGD